MLRCRWMSQHCTGTAWNTGTPNSFSKRSHEIERTPGRAEHIDRLCAVVAAEGAGDEVEYPLARQLRHLVEIDVDAGHVQAVKAGINEILRDRFG